MIDIANPFKEDFKLLHLDASPSYDKLDEAFRIFEDILDNLDDEGINELFGGTGADIDKAYQYFLQEITSVLFGNNGKLFPSTSHLQNMSEAVEEHLRIENLNYFISSALPNFEMNWHHLEWGDCVQRYNKLNIIAARDHGKSYFFSNAYAIWKLYRYQGVHNKFQRQRKDLQLSKKGYLFSFSAQQAKDLLEIMKGTIEENDLLREKLLPDSKSEGWSKTDITCKNGASLRVKGFGSSVRGAHPGWIVVDDGLKDNVIYSQSQRKKSIDYFHAVIMNMIVPDGQTVVVGTPFHSADLYGDLKTKAGWHVREYPAIFPDGKILWSNRWNLKGLLDKRLSQGNLIFSREILCRPVTNESSIFPYEVLQRAFIRMEDYTFVNSRDNFPIKFNKVVTGVDFSISSSIGADYTVAITAGIEDDGKMWLLNMQRFKGKSFSEQLAVLKSINSNFRPDIMMMENNVFQQIFVQESEKAGLPVKGHQTGTNKYDLKSGLPGLALLFERGMVRIPRGNQDSIDKADMIALELSSVTWTDKGLEGVGEHDDIAMALWITSIAAKNINTGFSFKFL